MKNPNEFFGECQDVLEQRASVRSGDRRFLAELGKAWAAQLEVFLASQGIALHRQEPRPNSQKPNCADCKKHVNCSVCFTAGVVESSNAVLLPPIPGHLVAAMFAVQKIFRGTFDPDEQDHAVDAVNYMYIAFDERRRRAE